MFHDMIIRFKKENRENNCLLMIFQIYNYYYIYIIFINYYLYKFILF